MPSRLAGPTDLPRISALLESSLRANEGIVASALPRPLAAGAVTRWPRLLAGLLPIPGRLRVYVEEYRGQLRSVALVYDGRRSEWVMLVLAALPEPGGAESAFRLLSGVSAAAARHGIQRLFAAVPDEARARECFFQAGFYSYTRETWFVSTRLPLPPTTRPLAARAVRGRDAHDLFRFYAATTPHAVQRAEQLTVQDFDLGRRGGAYDPPHLSGGNPLAMRLTLSLIEGDETAARAFALAFHGADRHPHVCKVRTGDGNVDLARDLVRAVAHDLPPGRPVSAPVRSYEEHVARALLAEGFREAGTAMLFVKELAVRIEEPALAPAVVR